MAPSPTISAGAISARDAWLAVETQFLGNRETCALYLDAEFRGFSQGDLSITDYCRRLQRMASDLGALGEVVSDRTLVLNLIRGLNERFANIGLHLRRSQPFPSFLEGKEALRLELTFAHQAATPTALVATQTTGPSPAGGTSNSKGGGGSGSGGAQAEPSKSRRSKRGGGGNKDATTSSQQPAGGAKGGSSLRPGQHTGTRGPGPSRCGQAHALPKLILRSRRSMLNSNSGPC